MSVRLIAFDLDNTFLYDADTVSRGNREALEDAAAEHVMTAIASGRVFTSLPAAVLAVPSVEYAITSNGAAIYKLPKEEGRLDENGRFDADRCFTHARCIHRISLPEDRVRAIMKLLEEYPSDRYPVSFETFINGKAYSCEDYIRRPERYGLSPAYIEYVRTTRTMVADMRQFILDHADTLDGLDLHDMCRGNRHRDAQRNTFLQQGRGLCDKGLPRGWICLGGAWKARYTEQTCREGKIYACGAEGSRKGGSSG